MSRDGSGPSNTADVAARLERDPRALGPTRAKSIAKGLVYAPNYGQIAYTVPGMSDFVVRQVS